MGMTSRERVKRAFDGGKQDRVPIDYFGNIGINEKLCKHFNTDYEGVLTALNVDFRLTYAPYKGKKLFPDREGMLVDPVYGYYARWIEHATGGYFDYSYFPLQDAGDEVIASYPVPDPDDFDYEAFDGLLKKYSDYALFVGNGGYADIINATGRVMGMEQTLINLALGDEATLTYINRRSEMELEQLERMLSRAKGRIDFLWMGEDLGTQIAPMISLELYRSTLRPIHQKYVDLAKAYNIPAMIHTCGSSSWAYEDFIDMGISAVDTLQPEAANMSPEHLVKTFGGRLSFHGCISTAGPLAYGGVDDVERDIIEKLEIMKPTRRYMFSPTHSIQDNSPLENVLHMYKCAVKYGSY